MSHPDINRLLDSARIHLPGAVDAALMIEFFAVMKKFFIETGAWREHVEFEVFTDSREYDIFVVNGAVVRLFEVRDEDGRPVAASMPVPGKIHLRAYPRAGGTYTAEVSLTVSDPTDRNDQPLLPLWAVNRYYDTLLDGLLGRMMSQPAKPYSSPQTALIRTRSFASGIAAARSEVLREHRFNGVRWRFPSFGN